MRADKGIGGSVKNVKDEDEKREVRYDGKGSLMRRDARNMSTQCASI